MRELDDPQVNVVSTWNKWLLKLKRINAATCSSGAQSLSSGDQAMAWEHLFNNQVFRNIGTSLLTCNQRLTMEYIVIDVILVHLPSV